MRIRWFHSQTIYLADCPLRLAPQGVALPRSMLRGYLSLSLALLLVIRACFTEPNEKAGI